MKKANVEKIECRKNRMSKKSNVEKIVRKIDENVEKIEF